MIKEKLHLRPHRLQFGNLSQELMQYKKMNLQLLRSIQEKDEQIEKLSSLIQSNKQHRTYTTKPMRKRNNRPRQIATILMSQNTQKNKENQNSIFRDNYKVIKKSSKSVTQSNHYEETSLPLIDKRFKNIFEKQDSINENLSKEWKIIKIPKFKLKPLNSEQVRKRFLLKLTNNEVQLQ